MKSVKIIFISGLAGVGKTTLSNKIVRFLNSFNEPTCLVDKDTVSRIFVNTGMKSLGYSEKDRDSEVYKKLYRDIEYTAVLDIARENLNLGIHVVCPAPWSKEIKEKSIFSKEALGLDNLKYPLELKFIHISLSEEETLTNIKRRKSERDIWKLDNWEEYRTKFKQDKKISDLIVQHNGLLIQSNEDNNMEKLFKYIK